MVAILVVLPAGVAPPSFPEGVDVSTCATAAEAVIALATATGDVVLCVDGLPGDTAEVAAAAAAVNRTVIEVTQEAWDGEEHSSVSAVCSGVIAGFGTTGISAAVALLRDAKG